MEAKRQRRVENATEHVETLRGFAGRDANEGGAPPRLCQRIEDAPCVHWTDLVVRHDQTQSGVESGLLE